MMRPQASPSLARVLGAALALACASSADAQGWSVGIKGGIGKGAFTGQQEFDWEPGALSAVGFLNRQLTPRLSIQPEVYETQRLGTSVAAGGVLTFNAHYLDLPVLVRYRLPGVGSLRPFLAAGPSLSLEVNCNLQFVTAGLVSNFKCGEASNALDFGAAGVAGMAWTVGISTLVVEARGSTNFRSVVLESRSSRGTNVAVLAGVSMPLSSLRRSHPTAIPRPFDPTRVDEPVGPSAVTLATPIVTESASGKRITVTAVGADARSLLVAIAREAGISLVVSDDVRRRVSLSLTNASPDEAIAAIVAQAGLSVAKSPSAALPAVVYYQLPVNVNQTPADAIAARFGVSAELAKWIVESRPPRSDRQP